MSRAPSRPAPRRRSCRASARGGSRAFGPVFAVDDTLRAMERLGVAARARARARIVAVTGSVGKTSAKEMLRACCRPAALTHASAASYNNHWGVPLTLARMPRGRALRRVRDRHESRRRDRAARAHGAAACRAGHDDRAGPHRASRLDRGDRRREGGDLRRPRAGRRRRCSTATRRNSSGWRKRPRRAARASAPSARDAECDARLVEVEATKAARACGRAFSAAR